jgi:4-amino-4-deoxy-L-arabinose transferase-like glycosyltransferase
MLLFRAKPLPRQTIAILSLTGITACKLVVFLLLLKAGYVQPYVGGGAHAVWLPVVNRILTTGTFNDLDTPRYIMAAPGYAVFLALAQWVSARWYLSLVVCLQMLLDYCVALLLLFLGNRETSIEAGWLGGVLWLVFPPAVIISTWVTTETLFTTLFVLSMIMLIRSLSQQGGVGLSFAAGLTLGVTTLVRGTTQLLPVFFFALSCFQGIAKRLLKCTLFLVGMCLLVLPWTLRNLYVLGEPIIVQTGFGGVFLMGSRSEYFTIEGMQSSYPVLRRQAAEEGLVQSADRKATSEDRWLFNLGLREYRIRLEHEPLSLLPLVIHKFARLWYGMEEGIFYKQLILGVCSLLTVPVGIFQIWLWRRDHFCLSIVLGLLFLYFIGLYMVTLPLFRYTFPLYPFLIFSASHQYIKLCGRNEMDPPLCGSTAMSQNEFKSRELM